MKNIAATATRTETTERAVQVGRTGKVTHRATVTTFYNEYDEQVGREVERPGCGAIRYRNTTAQAITVARPGTKVTCDKC